MRRLVGVLVRNWPLKLGAVALATILYAGLVFSQNVRVWPGPVRIEPYGQANDVYLQSITPEAVTSIRYLAPVELVNRIGSQSFTARVDLTGAQPGPGGTPVNVPVLVQAPDQRIQVTGWTPTTVAVRLDPIITRAVPIHVERGTVPTGLSASEPVLNTTTTTVRGPATVVNRVDRAEARVSIDASGIDVDEDAELVAVDAQGNPLTPLDLAPATVHVKIRVGAQETTRTVPIVPVISGTPPTGYRVAAVTVEPVQVTVSGERAVLATLDRIDTVPISVAGRTTDLDQVVALVLPAGVEALGTTTARVRVDLVVQTGSQTFTAGVVLAGAHPDRAYTLSTGSVQVTLGGPLAALASLDAASLRAVADVTALAVGTQEVTLSVPVPTGIEVVAISPPRITVTVAVPPSPSPSPTPVP